MVGEGRVQERRAICSKMCGGMVAVEGMGVGAHGDVNSCVVYGAGAMPLGAMVSTIK